MGRRALLAAAVVVALSASSAAAVKDGAAVVNHDCQCECCKEETCPVMKTHMIAVGKREMCTQDMCRSKLFDCPDLGSHSDSGQVRATYHDCTCECCRVGQCGAGLTQYNFDAKSAGQCTSDACASNFYGCPNAGGHTTTGNTDVNLDSRAFATYHDCMCGCTKDGVKANHFFVSGAKDGSKCIPAMCTSMFPTTCPSSKVDPEVTIETIYSGEAPLVPLVAAPGAPGAATVAKDGETVLPTYAVALLVILFVGTFVVLVGVLIYRRVQHERGFRWSLFEGAAAEDAVFDSPDGVGAQGAPSSKV